MKVCVVAYRIEKRLEPPFSSTNDLALLYLYIAEWLLPRGPGAITEFLSNSNYADSGSFIKFGSTRTKLAHLKHKYVIDSSVHCRQRKHS